MAFTLGIPRALLYYKYFPLWETFFTRLGVGVVVSPATNRAVLAKAIEFAESEFCLPVKVFHGHVLALRDQVDAIFVPRVVSMKKGTYTCPKFFGLPDIVACLPETLPPIISPVFNLRLGRRHYYGAVYELGHRFEKNPAKIFLAWQEASSRLKRFQREMQLGLTPVDLLGGGDETTEARRHGGVPGPLASGGRTVERPSGRAGANRDLVVGLVGHSYNLYDAYVSANLIETLRRYGVTVLVGEGVPHEVADREASTLPKELYWSYEREVVGAAYHWLRTGSVDGIVYLRSFACGPDSIVQVLLDDEARKHPAVSTMSLAIDEHTAEAGVITRVEAFLDMLQRKRWRRQCG